MAGRYTIEAVADLIRGHVCSTRLSNPNAPIDFLETDLRALTRPAHTLFLALSTQDTQQNCAALAEIYQRGVRNFVVHKAVNLPFVAWASVNVVYVSDPSVCLHALLRAHRQRLSHIPLVAVTGGQSARRIKEWLTMLLADVHRMGVFSYEPYEHAPLGLWRTSEKNTLILCACVSEYQWFPKANAFGSVLWPDIGVLAPVLCEGDRPFSQDNAFEVLSSFARAKYCVIPSLQPEWLSYAQAYKRLYKAPWQIVYFTEQETSTDLPVLLRCQSGANTTRIDCTQNGQPYTFEIPSCEREAVEGVLLSLAVVHLFGQSFGSVQQNIPALLAYRVSLSSCRAIQDCWITHNHSAHHLNNVRSALANIQYAPSEKKTLILSDFDVHATCVEQTYLDLAGWLQSANIWRLIGVGDQFMRHATIWQNLVAHVHVYPHARACMEAVVNLSLSREHILFSARVGSEMSLLVPNVLYEPPTQTCLEVDLSALRANIAFFRRRLRANTRMMLVVKASSYGTYWAEHARILPLCGADYLAVARISEGIALRNHAVHLPILVATPEPAYVEQMFTYSLEPTVFCIEELRFFVHELQKKSLSGYPIHLKIDTGMHRLGFQDHHVEELCAYLRQHHAQVCVKSIYSHFIGSEDEHFDDISAQQSARFLAISERICAHLPERPLLHIANTHGILRHPRWHFDMVRLGIGMYGIGHRQLKNVLTFRTTIVQILSAKAADSVGYNGRANLKADAMIATLSVGYADGYARALGNGAAEVLIRGKRAPTIGHVCMDMIMIDISTVPEAQIGDEVILFGPDLPIEQVAKQARTIAYELMCNVSARVRRVYRGGYDPPFV